MAPIRCPVCGYFMVEPPPCPGCGATPAREAVPPPAGANAGRDVSDQMRANGKRAAGLVLFVSLPALLVVFVLDVFLDVRFLYFDLFLVAISLVGALVASDRVSRCPACRELTKALAVLEHCPRCGARLARPRER